MEIELGPLLQEKDAGLPRQLPAASCAAPTPRGTGRAASGGKGTEAQPARSSIVTGIAENPDHGDLRGNQRRDDQKRRRDRYADAEQHAEADGVQRRMTGQHQGAETRQGGQPARREPPGRPPVRVLRKRGRP